MGSNIFVNDQPKSHLVVVYPYTAREFSGEGNYSQLTHMIMHLYPKTAQAIKKEWADRLGRCIVNTLFLVNRNPMVTIAGVCYNHTTNRTTYQAINDYIVQRILSLPALVQTPMHIHMPLIGGAGIKRGSIAAYIRSMLNTHHQTYAIGPFDTRPAVIPPIKFFNIEV